MAYEKQTWANGDTITAPKLNNIEGGVEGMNSSYEKQTWVTGEVITAEKLNHIEDGIANGGSGGGGSTYAPSDTGVTLRDYDGTVLGYYTNEEFNALTELPNPPAPQGLVATGWTATLEEAKASLAENGVVALGRIYETASGATEIDIVLPEERKSPTLGLGLNGTATIDWGDGSAEETVTGTSTTTLTNTQHQYASGGDYTIKVKITEGEASIIGDTTKGTRLLYDPNLTSVRAYASAIKKVRIGNSITSIGDSAFDKCYSLASVVIPDSVTSMGDKAFSDCFSLASAVIPESVTSFTYNVFSACNSLVSVVIPESVTNVYNAFATCYSLVSVVIPESVTTIEQSAFGSCYSLASVVIPEGVTSIKTRAFENCYSLASIKFENATPPTMGYSAFAHIPTDCVIKVPTGSLSAYTSASNYPSSSTYTYVEY